MSDVPLGPVEDREYTLEEARTWRFGAIHTLEAFDGGATGGRLPILVDTTGKTIEIKKILRNQGLDDSAAQTTQNLLSGVLTVIVGQEPTGVIQSQMETMQPLVVVPKNDNHVDRPPIDLVLGIGYVVQGIERDLYKAVEVQDQGPEVASIPVSVHQFIVGAVGIAHDIHQNRLAGVIPLVVTEDRETRQLFFSTTRATQGHVVVFSTPPGELLPSSAVEKLIESPQIQ